MKKLFMKVFFLICMCSAFANTTGISGVDNDISLGTRIGQAALGGFGVACAIYVAFLFGTQQAKGRAIELVIGLIAMAAIGIAGAAYWVSQTSGFVF